MCVLAFAFDPRPSTGDGAVLKIISNRDEFLGRPTQAAHWWPELSSNDSACSPEGTTEAAPEIRSTFGRSAWVLGGRDLRARGSWLAMNRAGRVAILTNYRDPSNATSSARSRGELVDQWVGRGNTSIAAEELAKRLASSGHDYVGFNLLLFDCALGAEARAWVVSNRASNILGEIAPGIHGLSNEILNSPWPKTLALKNSLEATKAFTTQRFVAESLRVLSHAQPAPDAELPSTGIPLERERYLSSVFIQPPNLEDAAAYGTRCSAILTIGPSQVQFLERSYYPQLSERRFSFRLSSAPHGP